MFFQSGGCCDGSLPICFGLGEFVLSDHDILLGDVGGCPFYIDHRQFEAWKHTQLILDVSDGLPEGFSLPAGADEHFVTNSRLYRPEPVPCTCLESGAEAHQKRAQEEYSFLGDALVALSEFSP